MIEHEQPAAAVRHNCLINLPGDAPNGAVVVTDIVRYQPERDGRDLKKTGQ